MHRRRSSLEKLLILQHFAPQSPKRARRWMLGTWLRLRKPTHKPLPRTLPIRVRSSIREWLNTRVKIFKDHLNHLRQQVKLVILLWLKVQCSIKAMLPIAVQSRSSTLMTSKSLWALLHKTKEIQSERKRLMRLLRPRPER